jgi:hypothetical protein
MEAVVKSCGSAQSIYTLGEIGSRERPCIHITVRHQNAIIIGERVLQWAKKPPSSFLLYPLLVDLMWASLVTT